MDRRIVGEATNFVWDNGIVHFCCSLQLVHTHACLRLISFRRHRFYFERFLQRLALYCTYNSIVCAGSSASQCWYCCHSTHVPFLWLFPVLIEHNSRFCCYIMSGISLILFISQIYYFFYLLQTAISDNYASNIMCVILYSRDSENCVALGLCNTIIALYIMGSKLLSNCCLTV
jgi:hypothetical protein